MQSHCSYIGKATVVDDFLTLADYTSKRVVTIVLSSQLAPALFHYATSTSISRQHSTNLVRPSLPFSFVTS